MCDNRPLVRRVEICILFSFPIFIVKNIGNICESRGSGTPDASVFFSFFFLRGGDSFKRLKMLEPC